MGSTTRATNGWPTGSASTRKKAARARLHTQRAGQKDAGCEPADPAKEQFGRLPWHGLVGRIGERQREHHEPDAEGVAGRPLGDGRGVERRARLDRHADAREPREGRDQALRQREGPFST